MEPARFEQSRLSTTPGIGFVPNLDAVEDGAESGWQKL
jgi:hypothetical protein